MCEERRNDNAECNELFGYLWLRKLIVPYFNRHNRNYCLGNMYSVCNSLLNVLLCCAVCVVTSWSPLYLILPAEFQSRCTDVISSNRWKYKAPCTKKCDVCKVKYWLQSRFRPSSAIQTKQVLFIFFHQNIPLFYAKFAPHIRDSLLRSIWPVPACTFLLTQVLLYLAQVDLSSLVCVPGGFSHPLLSRWNWIAIFFSLSPPSLLSAKKGNGQDVKLVPICCSREWAQYETHYIKKHFEFNEWDWPIHWQLCKQVLKV